MVSRENSNNILVAVRVRPRNTVEINTKQPKQTKVASNVIVIDDPAAESEDILRRNRSRQRKYGFDVVFDTQDTQEKVYENTTKFLVPTSLEGFNSTVFAYGATGSGKTFSMLGTEENPGIMVRTLQDLYRLIGEYTSNYNSIINVSLSYVEIYNENIRDLLSSSEEYLDLREDPIKGPVVAGVTQLQVTSTEHVMSLLAKGNRNRTQEATAANKESSRSHAVLQIFVEQKQNNGDKLKIGKLSLIDLAGSERASKTNNKGIRLVEGANINRSLLALGNCINALVTAKRGSYVPYRDSKLTRLLKDSLGGNCRTVMIATVSPTAAAFEETINTLKYANRAKNIKTKVSRNVLDVNYHISEYENLISGLRSEIATLQTKLSSVNQNSDSPKLDSKKSLKLNTSLQDQAFDMKVTSPGISRCMTSPREFVRRQSVHRLQQQQQLRAQLSKSRRAQRSSEQTTIDESNPSSSPTGMHDEDMQRLDQLRLALIDNFEERMQLRRSLIDLQATNVQNEAEIANRKVELAHWEHSNKQQNKENPLKLTWIQGTLVSDRKQAEHLRKEVNELYTSIEKNEKLKEDVQQRLEENEQQAKSLREELETNATNDDKRDVLLLQYQMGQIEIENMELEHSRMLHEHVVHQRDAEIRKLKLQIKARDRLIRHQAEILNKHSLAHNLDYDAVAAVDEELSIGDQSSYEITPRDHLSYHRRSHSQSSVYSTEEERIRRVFSSTPTRHMPEPTSARSRTENHRHMPEPTSARNQTDISDIKFPQVPCQNETRGISSAMNAAARSGLTLDALPLAKEVNTTHQSNPMPKFRMNFPSKTTGLNNNINVDIQSARQSMADPSEAWTHTSPTNKPPRHSREDISRQKYNQKPIRIASRSYGKISHSHNRTKSWDKRQSDMSNHDSMILQTSKEQTSNDSIQLDPRNRAKTRVPSLKLNQISVTGTATRKPLHVHKHDGLNGTQKSIGKSRPQLSAPIVPTRSTQTISNDVTDIQNKRSFSPIEGKESSMDDSKVDIDYHTQDRSNDILERRMRRRANVQTTTVIAAKAAEQAHRTAKKGQEKLREQIQARYALEKRAGLPESGISNYEQRRALIRAEMRRRKQKHDVMPRSRSISPGHFRLHDNPVKARQNELIEMQRASTRLSDLAIKPYPHEEEKNDDSQNQTPQSQAETTMNSPLDNGDDEMDLLEISAPALLRSRTQEHSAPLRHPISPIHTPNVSRRHSLSAIPEKNSTNRALSCSPTKRKTRYQRTNDPKS